MNRNFKIVPTGATNLLSQMRANDTFVLCGVTFRAISDPLLHLLQNDECEVDMEVAQLTDTGEWKVTRMEKVLNQVVERADVVYRNNEDTSEVDRRARLCARQTLKLLRDDADQLERRAERLRKEANRIEQELAEKEYGSALTIAQANLYDATTANRAISSTALRLLIEATSALESWNK